MSDPQEMLVLDFDKETWDYIVQCPICREKGRLMADFSLLASGFNGIKSGDPDDCDLQECGKCGYKMRWNNVPDEGPLEGEAISEKLKLLLLDACNTVGTYNPDAVLAMIEEKLTPDESTEVLGFLTWLIANDRKFGHGTIYGVWIQYQKEVSAA